MHTDITKTFGKILLYRYRSKLFSCIGKNKSIYTLKIYDIKQLKNIVNYLDNVEDEEALKAAEEIRGIWADINGEDVIPVLKDIQADGLGKNTFEHHKNAPRRTHIFCTLPLLS